MDFFGAQDRARSKTRYLILLFALGVCGIIGAIYTLFALALSDGTSGSTAAAQSAATTDFWRWDLFFTVAAVVSAIIFGASFFKTMALKAGGSKVAESVGGRKVLSNTTDPKERQLLNVVEEMSIASGVPMPDVYILDQEKAINAFAAGFNLEDAAVAVTRGTLDQLNRDELQGVIAHEYSHILSGDMRINIRLMGIIFGILVIYVLGNILFRNAMYRRAFSGGGGKNDGAKIGIIALGGAIMLIGWIGVLFGRLIQAAISRQREFLADSSAVQFTRNPDGIAGALRKIGGLESGSRIENPHAQEVAHMFFSAGLSSMFATHPPLKDRIAAIQPGGAPDPVPQSAARAPEAAPSASPSTATTPSVKERSEAMLNGIGVIAGGALARAATQRESLHQNFGRALEETDSAVALAIALLLDDASELRDKQIGMVRDSGLSVEISQIESFVSRLSSMSPDTRFTVLDLAVAPLRKLESKDAEALIHLLETIADADECLTLDEFLILRGVRKHLRVRLHGPDRSDRLIEDPTVLSPAIRQLLSYVARTGTGDSADAALHLKQAVGEQALLEPLPDLEYAEPSEDLRDLEPALETLAHSAFKFRHAVIRAATAIVVADETVTADEISILRAVALSLGIPVPPVG